MLPNNPPLVAWAANTTQSGSARRPSSSPVVSPRFRLSGASNAVTTENRIREYLCLEGVVIKTELVLILWSEICRL